MKIRDFVVYGDSQKDAMENLSAEMNQFTLENPYVKIISHSHNVFILPSENQAIFCATALICYREEEK